MDLDLIDLPVVSEDHQIGVRRGYEEVLDEIFVLRRSSESALAATALTRVGRDWRTFDVARLGDRDRNVFVLDQIFDRKFNARVDEESEIMIITQQAKLIRLGVDKIRETGRSAQGVTLIKTGDDDLVTSASLLAVEAEEEE